MLRCLAFEPTSYRTCFFVVGDEAPPTPLPPPGSKEDGRGGNDGTDIAIMPHMSFKTPLPFLRPCLRTDSPFSAVFTLFSIIRILLLRAGSVALVAFPTNSNCTSTFFSLRLSSLPRCSPTCQVCQEIGMYSFSYA